MMAITCKGEEIPVPFSPQRVTERIKWGDASETCGRLKGVGARGTICLIRLGMDGKRVWGPEGTCASHKGYTIRISS